MTANCPENILIIFIKYPRKGTVKTRLAKDLGEGSSAFLYRKFTETIVQRTNSDKYRQVVFYTPKAKRGAFRKWLGKDLDLYLQEGKSLGQRMSNAFRLLFEKGAKRIVIIGSDSPLLDKKLVEKAFQELEKNGSVVGPCLDGGYYLLGLSSFCKELFENIAWSRNTVFKETLGAIKRQDLSLRLLPKSFDVDRKNDLYLLLEELEKPANKGLKSLKDEIVEVLRSS